MINGPKKHKSFKVSKENQSNSNILSVSGGFKSFGIRSKDDIFSMGLKR